MAYLWGFVPRNSLGFRHISVAPFAGNPYHEIETASAISDWNAAPER